MQSSAQHVAIHRRHIVFSVWTLVVPVEYYESVIMAFSELLINFGGSNIRAIFVFREIREN